jgi:poly-gamma-glutamate synthesis protein (capsule biosynthesis protein)
MLGENVHHFHRGIVRKYRNNYPSLISDEVKRQLSSADLLLMNFEASLAEDDALQKMGIDRAVYVAPLQSLDLLDTINTQVIVNIANNHFGQHGQQSALYSIGQLESRGILVTGRNNRPLEISNKSQVIKIFGVSLVKDKHYEGAYFKSSYETLLTDLQLIPKSENEIWIISIHWGEEYLTLENKKQQILARELAGAGFDYIIGHHPHVVQPYARIGKTAVFYSHGNFIFDQNFSGLTQKGLVSQINLHNGETELFISRQRKFTLTEMKPVTTDELTLFTKASFHKKQPLLMRIKMKLELFLRFYELNFSIMRTFALKRIKK